MGNHDIKILNSLVATTLDSARGYEDAAERASDDHLKPAFERFARERGETAERLKDEVRQFGGTPEDGGTLKAAAHRRWLDLKDALTKGNEAVLKSVEAGEAYICKKFEAALDDRKLSPGARKAVADAFTSIASGKAQVSELRRRFGLPEAEQGSRGSWNKVGVGLGAAAVIAGVAVAARRSRSSMGAGDRDADFALKLETDESLRLISSKKVEGTPVIGRDGERLGKVDSFMVDKYSGRVGYAVMTFGGTMGFGESLFPLPWAALTYDEDVGGYVLPIAKVDLRNAPRFEPSDEPEFSPEYRRQILVFYRRGDGQDRDRAERSGSAAAASSGARAARAGSSRRDDGKGGASNRTTASRNGRRDEGPDGEPLAARGSEHRLGQSSGSSGSFGSTTGGSFGASGGGYRKPDRG